MNELQAHIVPPDALERLKAFLAGKRSGQIVMDVDGGGKIVHVAITEHYRLPSVDKKTCKCK